jgi:hypothetical protein
MFETFEKASKPRLERVLRQSNHEEDEISDILLRRGDCLDPAYQNVQEQLRRLKDCQSQFEALYDTALTLRSGVS